jgi:hypothetical protein
MFARAAGIRTTLMSPEAKKRNVYLIFLGSIAGALLAKGSELLEVNRSTPPRLPGDQFRAFPDV